MPVARRYAYFDHAAVAPLTTQAAAEISSYAQQASLQGDVLWPNWAGKVHELRLQAASLIGASPDEIALVNNTTHGIGLVAEGFPWKSGDNVVVPENEFPSNLLPWRALARRGVELRLVAVDPSGAIDLNRLRQAMDARTRIVSVSWVGFASGYRIDVAEVAEVVHAQGGLFFLDAIQGLGAFPLDVEASQVDFLSADGHKWMLGPEGAGLCYIRRQHLEHLQPLGIGWNSLAAGSFDPASAELKTTAARYEGGSCNMPGMLGFGASLKLLNELPGEQVSEAVLSNVHSLADLLQRADFTIEMPSQERHRSGILRIGWGDPPVPESVLMAARKHCSQAGVVLSVRGGRLRASTHAYNNVEDRQRLLESLQSFRASL